MTFHKGLENASLFEKEGEKKGRIMVFPCFYFPLPDISKPPDPCNKCKLLGWLVLCGSQIYFEKKRNALFCFLFHLSPLSSHFNVCLYVSAGCFLYSPFFSRYEATSWARKKEKKTEKKAYKLIVIVPAPPYSPGPTSPLSATHILGWVRKALGTALIHY